MERWKKPARASVATLAMGAAGKILSFFATPVFTRVLSPDELGVFADFSALFAVVSVAGTLALGGGILSRGLQRFGKEREPAFLSAALGLALTALTLLFPLSLPLLLRRVSPGFCALLFIATAANAAIGFYTVSRRYRYHTRFPGLFAIAEAILSPALSLALIFFARMGGEGRVIGSVATAVLLSLPPFFVIFGRGKVFFSREVWRWLLEKQLPLLPHYLGMALLAESARLALPATLGAGALARYAVASSLGLSLSFFSHGVASSFHPWVLRRIRSREVYRVRESVSLLFAALSLGTVLLLFFAPEALRLLAPASYGDALTAVYPLALSVPPAFLLGVTVTAGLTTENGLQIGLLSLAAGLLSLLFSFLFLPVYGLRAGGFILLFFTLALTALQGILLAKAGGVSIYPSRGAIFAYASSLLLASLADALSPSFPARLALALPLFVFSARILLPKKEILLEGKD